MSDEEPLDGDAATLRMLFIRRKQLQTRNPRYSPGASHDRNSIWNRAAEKCRQAQLEPAAVVNALFEWNTVPGGPYSAQLATYGVSKAREAQEELTRQMAEGFAGDASLTPAGKEKENLINEINSTLRFLRGGTDMDEINTVTIERLLLDICPGDHLIKVLLGFEDDRIMMKYFHKASQRLQIHPEIKKAAISIGFPVPEILARGQQLEALGLVRTDGRKKP